MYPPEVFLAVALLEAQRLPTNVIYHNARHIKRKTFLGGGLFSVQLACHLTSRTHIFLKDNSLLHRQNGSADSGDIVVGVCLK